MPTSSPHPNPLPMGEGTKNLPLLAPEEGGYGEAPGYYSPSAQAGATNLAKTACRGRVLSLGDARCVSIREDDEPVVVA
jgi:hypothetical protein